MLLTMRKRPSYSIHMPNLAGRQLAALLERGGVSQVQAARAAGVSSTSLGYRLRGGRSIGTVALVAAARAAGATLVELQRLEVLDALDRGALPLPEGADEDRVRRALAILRGEAA